MIKINGLNCNSFFYWIVLKNGHTSTLFFVLEPAIVWKSYFFFNSLNYNDQTNIHYIIRIIFKMLTRENNFWNKNVCGQN